MDEGKLEPPEKNSTLRSFLKVIQLPKELLMEDLEVIGVEFEKLLGTVRNKWKHIMENLRK